MELNTAAAVIRFAQEVEEKSGQFYADCAEKYEDGEEEFLAFVRENKKNVSLVKRAYYGVISDALEACFSFKGLTVDEYRFDIECAEKVGLPEILKMSFEIEDKIQKFYQRAGELSEGLLADVPRALKKVAGMRNERKHTLEALLKRTR